MTLSDFLSYFEQPRKIGRNWRVKCPAHADRSPSLSVAEGDKGNIILYCFAGCTSQEIVAALNLKTTDLFDDSPSSQDLSRKRDFRRREGEAARAEREKAALRFRADRVIEAATGIDISGFTSEQLDRAMDLIGDAHKILFQEVLEEWREELDRWVQSWPAGVFDEVISSYARKEVVNG